MNSRPLAFAGFCVTPGFCAVTPGFCAERPPSDPERPSRRDPERPYKDVPQGISMQFVAFVSIGLVVSLLAVVMIRTRMSMKSNPKSKADADLKEAQRRIKKLTTFDTELDLSDLSSLHELPSILQKYTQLTAIDLSGTAISSVSILAELPGLQVLNIQNTQVKEIHALSSNKKLKILLRNTPASTVAARIFSQRLQISKIEKDSAKEALIQAQQRLADTQGARLHVDLSDLSALEILPPTTHIDPRIISINLANTKVSDITNLLELSNLMTLRLSGSRISNIANINRLSNLTDLYIDKTVITDVEPVLGMNRLRFIDVSDTLILDMSPIWLLKDCIENTKYEVLRHFEYEYKNTPAEKEQSRRLAYEKTIQETWRVSSRAAFKQAEKIISCTGEKAYRVSLVRLYALEQLPEKIAKFTALDSLIISHTKIQSLDFLNTMRSLTSGLYTIEFEKTLIQDVTPLARFSALHTIDCGSSLVKSLSGLERLHDLKKLIANSTQIDNLSALRNCRKLEELFVGGCQITDLKPIRELVLLQQLYCWKNPIKSTEGIENLRELRELNLKDTLITDISAFASLKSLEQLDLENTEVDDLSALSQLQNLRCLTLDGTRIKSLAPLKNLTNLTYLSVRNTAIEDYSEIACLISNGLDAHGAMNNPVEPDKRFLVALKM